MSFPFITHLRVWLSQLLTAAVRPFKRMMPRGLFGRTLLIIVVPTFIALAVATFVFFDRHWTSVNNRLTQSLAGEIALVVDYLRANTGEADRAEMVRYAREDLSLYVTFTPGKQLKRYKSKFPNPLRDALRRALNERFSYPIAINTHHKDELIAIYIEAPDGLYTILVSDRRIYLPTTEVFIAWMVGSSIILSVIALLFMRNQVRPIRRLAEAADAMGKGGDAPWFKLEGAREVRQASAALLVMHDRLRRQIEQRTTMLAGVSHDLRTPLTRMKLQLALMPTSPETDGFKADIQEMETMVEAYLAFARGDEGETADVVDMLVLLQEIAEPLLKHGASLLWGPMDAVNLTVRRYAMKRCLGNLVGNALRYGTEAKISMIRHEKTVDIIVDDNGPGIAPSARGDVFKPFLRLDASRNRETGGVGLGLTIARDIARHHGGDVALEDSPLGGLRARVWLPL